MGYEMRELSGSLFKNDKRELESHPNMNGSALIDGVEFWISAWTKTSANGVKWKSLQFKRKEARQPAARPEPSQYGKSGFEDMDDDICF